jgi:demethylmenaquinone methyltransferase / 2-methoxy-6-polyprenyl-1,4-benzoquinol methylase
MPLAKVCPKFQTWHIRLATQTSDLAPQPETEHALSGERRGQCDGVRRWREHGGGARADRVSVGTSARKEHAKGLFAALPRSYDAVGAALSFGQDPRWRRRMVAAIEAKPGDRVLDVATGTGLVAAEIVRRWGCDVVGLDQSPEMLDGARRRAEQDEGLARRLKLVQGEAERLPFADAELDHLTFTYLLRYVEDPGATMRELARVVKPGGRVASLEFAVPGGQPWHALWRLYVNVGLPTLGRLVSREWAATGRFLARSIPEFYARFPVPTIVELWRDAGIEEIHVEPMSLGGGIVMWGVKGGGVAAAGEHRGRFGGVATLRRRTAGG